MNRVLKRLFLGRPVSSHEELHHRLSKKIALAVFSSDALSSSAYATDEIILQLAVAGAAATQFSLPIALAVAGVLSVVVTSYRQTVKAYPSGGGAFIVTRENLGDFPGLIAASSLLIDYVLTVSVSVAAGVAAVAAAFVGLRDHRVGMAVVIVALITLLNLRGLKESGTVFAIPTYGFLVAMFGLIAIGAYKAFSGTLEPVEVHEAARAVEPIGLFLILRAFSSGCTALTGVEAISDGVPAFRKPEWRNASQTLLILGGLLTVLFLGVTFLARAVHVDPHAIEEGQTVISQIARQVFHNVPFLFFVVQVFTAFILFLAANTSYADFPRLASILGRERFLPRVFQNRGDRLAFSNGILILAIAASVILAIFKADVHRIIPLYVVGVFTSFTLSQTGMVIRWIRLARSANLKGEKAPRGWQRSAAISGVGAVTTFVVLIVVAVTKFLPKRQPGEGGFPTGAWIVIVLIPVVAYLLSRVRAHYRHVERELAHTEELPAIESNRAVLVVTRFKGTTKALAFARAIAPSSLRVVAVGAPKVRLADLRNRWASMGITNVIEDLGTMKSLSDLIDSLDPTIANPVTVILPDAQYQSLFQQVLKNRLLLRMKRKFLSRPGVVVISVPFQPDQEPEPAKLRAPGRLSIIVLVSNFNRPTLRAIQYARSLHPSELKAISVMTDTGEAANLTGKWNELKIPIPLEIVDSPYRSLIEPVLAEVRDLRPNPTDAVGVVIPEFVVKKWWQALLHNQTAFLLKTALLFEPNVVVINIPYVVSPQRGGEPAETAAGKD